MHEFEEKSPATSVTGQVEIYTPAFIFQTHQYLDRRYFNQKPRALSINLLKTFSLLHDPKVPGICRLCEPGSPVLIGVAAAACMRSLATNMPSDPVIRVIIMIRGHHISYHHGDHDNHTHHVAL